MPEIYIITEPCIGVKDKACQDVCPVNCIHEADQDEFPQMLFIHPDECIGCGVCEPECPVEAIYEQPDVPEEWTEYIQLNADFFKKHCR
jgi:NAD-dependent dihydropyrimidine dehydrogenase PreA subunit